MPDKYIQHGSDQQAAGQQQQYSDDEAIQRQRRDSRLLLATSLPEETDRLLQPEPGTPDEDAALEQSTQLRKREERHRPESLEEEDIGLQHVSGINEEEVGKELNVTGEEDNDEDDNGNPVSPAA